MSEPIRLFVKDVIELMKKYHPDDRTNITMVIETHGMDGVRVRLLENEFADEQEARSNAKEWEARAYAAQQRYARESKVATKAQEILARIKRLRDQRILPLP